MHRAPLLLPTLALLLGACTQTQTPTTLQPQTLISTSGDLGAHDPTIIKAGTTYYAYTTGIERTTSNPGGIIVHVSDGGIGGPWRTLGEIPAPTWTRTYSPKNVWAPEIVQNGSTYYLYYAVSQFGTNTSAIGVATTTTPGNPASWRDHGAPVVTSGSGTTHNAIDPAVFNDNGTWWMSFGSFFSGIKLQRLASMTQVTGPITTLATRPAVQHNPVEAPSLMKRGGYYYLFTSWDNCCRGLSSTYNIRVGRATSITGPYTDKNGVRLDQGGGSLVLESRLNQTGPGGQDIQTDGTTFNLVYHYYDTNANGAPKLAVRQLGWNADWPVP
ncbi:arabinan endo-1,5-alpha-L-arabinosidase [Deinococcus maricopensis]|uniref:Arabinan endo-1,5-alpha-L-arabinosidase n=1 Tax=Deinococcus maricopensis (strain DSM 21211 / LMG 22137 / NRRL B-23946 / LB-34) TaxID=709986 RepID=E8U472_DEIML|nr:arabinan endo-1,5-alpha-L-arabinosidase [Deinococcus maricopensis]ADV65909.1 Arabinan endo-1,5-alpha-L-arabinosidase [Deinococcus maricopensis DSM 21211]